jgi:hypothetical protein
MNDSRLEEAISGLGALVIKASPSLSEIMSMRYYGVDLFRLMAGVLAVSARSSLPWLP